MEGQWPSPEDVRADLVKLRRGFGIRYESMSVAVHLQTLRVVHNEATRQERSLLTDAGHLAYDVVRCVAHSEAMLGTRIKRLMTVTLNFDQSDTSLEQRRLLLREEFKLGEDAFDDFEERAYQQTAGFLVGLDFSPCAGDPPDSKDFAAFEKRWRAVGDFEAIRLIEMGFERLTLSRSHDEAVREATRILETIPKGSEFADLVLSTSGLDSARRLARIVRGIATNVYGEWLFAHAEGTADVFTPHDFNEYADGISAYGFEGEADVIRKIAQKRWRKKMGGVGVRPGDKSLQEAIRPVRREQRASVLVLAEIMMTIERADAWAVIGPDGEGLLSVLFPAAPVPNG